MKKRIAAFLLSLFIFKFISGIIWEKTTAKKINIHPIIIRIVKYSLNIIAPNITPKTASNDKNNEDNVGGRNFNPTFCNKNAINVENNAKYNIDIETFTFNKFCIGSGPSKNGAHNHPSIAAKRNWRTVSITGSSLWLYIEVKIICIAKRIPHISVKISPLFITLASSLFRANNPIPTMDIIAQKNIYHWGRFFVIIHEKRGIRTT